MNSKQSVIETQPAVVIQTEQKKSNRAATKLETMTNVLHGWTSFTRITVQKVRHHKASIETDIGL